MKNLLKEFLFSLFFSVILSTTYSIQTTQSCKTALILLALIVLYVYIFFVTMKHFSATKKHYIRLPALLLSKFMAQGSGFFLFARFCEMSHDKYDYIMLIIFVFTLIIINEHCDNSIKTYKSN